MSALPPTCTAPHMTALTVLLGRTAQILTNEEGASRGVGFVNFADTVCASKAVAALHNLPIGDRNLHVTFQVRVRSLFQKDPEG